MMVSLRVSLVSPRIVNKIRENPRDTPETFPVHPPLPPPIPRGNTVCLGIQLPLQGEGGGEAFPSEGLGGGFLLRVSPVSPRITNKIRENPRDTRRVFLSIPLYLPLSKREHSLLWYSAPSPRRGRGGEAFPRRG